MQFKTLALLAAVGTAVAQRPSNTSICDYYTTALLKENNSTNQYTLLTLVVNTAVIGNYTKPNVGIRVPGILAAGMYNDTAVNLLPYFDGGLASTNDGGDAGVAVNFLDDGGAVPLMNNMPANGTNSNQYTLLTHLYEYFGVLLGCSMMNTTGFPGYGGDSSQYQVHKFMALDQYQVGYFIQQVGLSAASFGVATEDVTAVGMALTKLFNYKCAPPTTVVPYQGDQLQAICIADTCPLSPNDTCSKYAPVIEPFAANATLAMGEGRNGSSNATGSPTTSSTPPMVTKNAAAQNFGSVAAVLGAAALAFAL
ncbi:MAG: hypothetical protein M1830_004998 [Pleopsidium flavum]|nr:MAG: hypothetical protein M1830_004998 [Pleopsidium flavum]